MTEKEADNIICYRTIAPISSIDGGTNYAPMTCLGSKCSAWRWVSELNPQPFMVDKSVLKTWTDNGYTVLSESEGRVKIQAPLPIHGYCGAAGPLHPGQ